MTRDIRLRGAQDPGQFRDVEPVLREHPQQAEARRVTEQSEQGRGALHEISESTYIDIIMSMNPMRPADESRHSRTEMVWIGPKAWVIST